MTRVFSALVLLVGLSLVTPQISWADRDAGPRRMRPAARVDSKPGLARLLARTKQAAAVGRSFLRGTFIDGPQATWQLVKQHKWGALGTVAISAAAIYGIQYLAAQLGVPVTPAQIAAGMIALHTPRAIGEARRAHRAGGARGAARSLGKSLGFPTATLLALEATAGALGHSGGAEHPPAQAPATAQSAPGLASCLGGTQARVATAGQLAACTGGGAHMVAEQAHLAELGASTSRAIASRASVVARAAEELEAAEGLLTRLGRSRKTSN